MSDVYDFEFIFINDGSSDDTFNKLKTNQDNNMVKVLNFSPNFGKENAMLAGLDYASGDASIFIDADLQMPIKYINEMLMFWQEGYKLVLTYKSNRNKGLKSKLASSYYDVFNKISDHQILKDALDLQLMDKSVVEIMTSISERNRFLKGIMGFIGYNYKVIPVEITERKEGNLHLMVLEHYFLTIIYLFTIHYYKYFNYGN